MVDYSHAWRVFYSKPHIRDAASRSEDAERLWRGEAVRSLEVNMATGSLDEISDRLQNDLLDQNRAFQKERRYLLDFMQQFDRLATTVDQSVKKGTEPSESDKNEIAKVYLKAIAIQNNHKCFFDSDIARLLSEDRKLDGNQRKFRDLRLNIHQYVRGVLNTCKSAARNFGVISGKYLNSDFSTADVMREYNKIVASYREGVRLIRTEYSENNDDLSNNRRPRHSALTRLRSAAKADVIAQVLNYSAGLPEDASGGIFFYPIQNTSDQCTYKIAVDEASPWASISKEMLLSVEQVGLDAGINELNNPFNQIIDLKKPNLANINFYSLRGVKRNKFTGAVGTLRYQSRIEGLPDLFECDSNSCNLERLGRGWALVRDKCKGTTKPF
jgi:hypothetical protein